VIQSESLYGVQLNASVTFETTVYSNAGQLRVKLNTVDGTPVDTNRYVSSFEPVNDITLNINGHDIRESGWSVRVILRDIKEGDLRNYSVEIDNSIGDPVSVNVQVIATGTCFT
jgi:hypothetical protein